jgi:hypothetical protein
MKKILSISLIPLLILILVHHPGAAAENKIIPKWVSELKARINQTFRLQAKASAVKESDPFEKNKYFSFHLKGNGHLDNVSDPFEKMERLFLADGWKTNDRYQADGHGSSSFAYEKDKYFCLISIQVDSSCDDEEEGHVPSEFWFEIYCRENDEN